jgi:hypothetical protein
VRQRWEGLQTWQQIAIGFPLLFTFTFLLNLGPFAQPLIRSILYGIFEGGVLTGLLLAATATERSRRDGGDG